MKLAEQNGVEVHDMTARLRYRRIARRFEMEPPLGRVVCEASLTVVISGPRSA